MGYPGRLPLPAAVVRRLQITGREVGVDGDPVDYKETGVGPGVEWRARGGLGVGVGDSVCLSGSVGCFLALVEVADA